MSKKNRVTTPSQPSARNGWRPLLPAWGALFLICLAGLAAYLNTFTGSFHFDDETSIIFNPAIRNLGDLKGIFLYSPMRFVTFLSFALNYRLGELNVVGYHCVNLFLHLASTVVLWFLARQIFSLGSRHGADYSKSAPTLALLAALVFALHPVQTQAVTYVAQRGTLLATLLYLTSVCCYVMARTRHLSGGSKLVGAVFLMASAASAFVGLLSKEIILTLPFALLLIEAFFISSWRRPGWIIAALFVVAFAAVPFVLSSRGLIELSAGGAPSREVYLLTQTRVLLTYLRLVVLPIDQNLDYDFALSKSLWHGQVILSSIVLLALMFVSYKLYPRRRIVSFGILFFFLALLPESSILPLPDVIYEHRLYLPMAGLSMVIALLFFEVTQRWRARSVTVLIFVVAVVLGILTYERNGIWKDEVTLWSDVILKAQNKPRPYSNRAKGYIEQKKYDQAFLDLNHALVLDPNFGDAYNNRGNVYLALGQYDKAILDYESARRVGISYSGIGDRLLYNLGAAYFNSGETAKSIDFYSQAINANPQDPTYYYNRALGYSRAGSPEKALKDYDQAIRLNPNYAKACNNRGALYEQLGDIAKALNDYSEAAKLDPTFPNAHVNRGRMQAARGEDADAILAFTRAISQAPNRMDIFLHRGKSYLKIQDRANALTDFQKAIALDPLSGEAYYCRGLALEGLGRGGEAQQSFRTATGLGYKKGNK